MRQLPTGSDFDGWVGLLAVSTKRQAARRHLMRIGARAVPAIRRGVHHPEPAVRRACVSMLDQLVDEEAIPDLVGALDDDDPEVLRRALHALACDRCKQNECHPGDELWVERAIGLARHEHVDVRAGAIDALAKAAGRRADVSAALLAIADAEPDRGLSEMARRAAR